MDVTALMSEGRYTYRVVWSPDDGEYVATVEEFPSLSWLDINPVTALRRLVELVADAVDDELGQRGETGVRARRLAADNGVRHSLDDVITKLGFSRAELEAELDDERGGDENGIEAER